MQEHDESFYDVVYGDTFSLYSKEDFLEFLEPLRIRFERNQLSGDIFKDKICLDAGCGNGRGSLFMLGHGARHVQCFDISPKNIATTTKFLKDFGFRNFTVTQGSLENIPFGDEAFDVVWCNGVIMHTKHPNRCLEELSRVLKVGGRGWLYVYGSGGILGWIVQKIRNIVRDIPVPRCIEILTALQYETRYIAEFIDDWYASYLRAYTHDDFGPRLQELGFADAKPLPYGVDYDTNHRLNTSGFVDDASLLGEGDLRYLFRKVSPAQVMQHPLSEDEYGSRYRWPASYRGELEEIFDQYVINAVTDVSRIRLCSSLQKEIRLALSKAVPLSMEDVKYLFAELRVRLNHG